MSDTSYPVFEHYGTAAERVAFVPAPPATGQPIYVWYETDTNDVYFYTTAWHGPLSAGSGGGSRGRTVLIGGGRGDTGGRGRIGPPGRRGATGAAGAGGGVVVQKVTTPITTATNGSTTIPYDNTKPQNTEGDEYMASAAFTPTDAANDLEITVVFVYTNSAVVFEIVALFRDAGADAIAAVASYNPAGTAGGTITFSWREPAGSTTPTTFTVRAGGNVAGTTYFNSHSSFTTGLFNGVSASSITIEEIVP